MDEKPRGRDLFIVDNSVSGWTGLRYLEEWTEIARGFDIATGNFEIGALLALDGKWQKLDKIRILMGAETTYRTRKAFLDAVRAQAVEALNNSIEVDKQANPFLAGVPAILQALRSGQIECRVYDKDKFHAKAYITHARLEVVGSQALVGSSNFSAPGLTKNIELNVQIQSAREVAQLQEWFESHWQEATEVTEAVIETIERHTRLYSPFDVYAKALQEFFRGHELTATEWDETFSRMFPRLDRYQQEAYWALMKIARQHSGAFLCDGVGLGKTFVGLMLIERLILHERKNVVLFAPKSVKEAVWDRDIRKYLPHVGDELVLLHLLESSKLNRAITTFIGGRSSEVEKISWSRNTVWVDKAQTIGFQGVREHVWNFHIGGYQVCEKWLKDRKGRTLSKDDIAHYHKIVVALSETVRLMEEIDDAIEKHGGWPGAFAQGDGTAHVVAIETEDAANLVPLARPKSTAAAYQTAPSQLLKAAEPEASLYVPVASAELDAARSNPDELDREDLICRIRQLFGDGQERERDKAIDALARGLGYQRTGTRIHEELDNALRTAVRRGILASEAGAVCLFARTIEQYDRDFLKEQFLASLLGRQWIEREDAVRAFARWMGFRRTGPAIEDAARSLINGLLRDGRLESDGSQIRRSTR